MNKSRKILILGLNYAPEPTGNAPYTSGLAEGLAAAGHQVNVLTGYPHYPEWQLKAGYSGWSRNEVIKDVRVRRLRHFIPRSPTSAHRMHMELSFGIRLLFANWHRPDVVLVVSPALFASGLAVLRARFCLRRPAVGMWIQDIYSRGITETGTGGNTTSAAVRTVESLILRSTDGVVAIHDRFRKYLIEELGVSATRVRVIRNWTHLPASTSENRSAFRSSMGWGEQDVVVLHAGNMGMKQGLENVIKAAKVSQDRGSCVRFVLMGDGNQRKQLESLAAGITKIDFVPPLPDSEFQAALAAADILLVNELPGIKDMAVPSKLTSYFNAGVPIIAATDDGSVTASEIMASGGGIRVDAADPASLVEAAEALGQDSAKSAELGAKGLQFRHETLSESAAVAHYDDFVSSLASSRGR